MIPTDSINSFFSSLLPRICLLGSKLLASTSYHECSRNDTLLSQAYGNDEQFWRSNPLSYVNGVPGITSDSFVGEYLTKINRVFKRRPEIKENITCKDYRLIRDLTKLLRRRQRERLLKRNCCYEQNNNSALATRFFVHFFAVLAQLQCEMNKFQVDLRKGAARNAVPSLQFQTWHEGEKVSKDG